MDQKKELLRSLWVEVPRGRSGTMPTLGSSKKGLGFLGLFRVFGGF